VIGDCGAQHEVEVVAGEAYFGMTWADFVLRPFLDGGGSKGKRKEGLHASGSVPYGASVKAVREQYNNPLISPSILPFAI
jgi:hypothetical protein